ncbi:hypothetical protein QCA50_006541 [Cerrena zonata]|uniref:Uncharacterized protein n=1 Tax=Cerrena zonata TaxID=2478898 RepID=A0AAW0GBS6_9APHY
MKNAGAAVSSGERGKSREEQMKAAMKDKQNSSDPGGDEVVNASTEKLSAVFDWIVDQVPSRNSSPPSSSSNSSGVLNERPVTPKAKSDLSSKADLERFYVALCKKLYDEGL